jgi:DNA-binding IscR family transcriptional regulator
LPYVTVCRRDISNRYFSRSCTTASSKGIRGPHGGYELVRDQKGVTVNDILHAAGTVDEEEEELKSEIVTKVVLPVLSPAEQAFGQALNEIKLDDMVRYSPVKRLRT